MVISAVQQRLTTTALLAAELQRIRRHGRRDLLGMVLGDLADGAQSLGELDAHFEGYGVLVEIDGIAHLRGFAPLGDALR